ncbi:AAA family ATPase [Slackia piriformis]|nr:AAA family ATPase [Slackia piriformis]
MARIRNPFTPTFGMVPPVLAGRDRLLDEMADAFEDGMGNPNLSTIIVGARGTGKTALLSCIADEAQSRGWIAVNVVAAEGMLEDIVQQAGKAAAHIVEKGAKRRLSGVSVGQVLGLEWVFDEEGSANWRSRMEELFEKLAEQDMGILVTVDEVRTDVDEMVQLVSTYQLFVREGRKASLVMAGLPSNVTDLVGDERITFLRRARQRHLGRISDGEIARAFRSTIENAGKEISPEALACLVEASRGFAYMMQLVGYFTWFESGTGSAITEEHARRGVALARSDFEAGVLDATYREMSKGDREFARAMLPDKDGSRLTDIAARMGKGTNYASTYKTRLMKQGVIGELPGGGLDFEMPFLREYLAEKALQR